MAEKLKFTQMPFWKQFGQGIVLISFALIVFIVGIGCKLYWDYSLEKTNNDTIAQTNEDALQVQQEQTELENQENEVRVSVTGMDIMRKRSDDVMMADLLKNSVTWSDKASYAAARDKMLAKYPYLDESSQFLTTFFPSIDTINQYETINNGNKLLQDGCNLKFLSLTTHVVAINEGVYSYVADMVVQSDGLAGGSATGHVIVTYDVDADRQAVNIKAYTVS